MAEIRFGDYSQDFERFFSFAHLIICGVCALLGLLSIFGEDHFRYLPVIFFLAGLLAFLDAYNSFREYEKQSTLKLKPAGSKREERRNILYLLEHADRQIVGNYLFSTWRDYTHWCIPYGDEYATDFLRRIIAILESKY